MIRRFAADGLAAAALIGLMFAIHDVPSMLTTPYWLDEAWVAAAHRFPLADLPSLVATSPLGWAALVRAVPDLSVLRLVPLGFLLVAVIAAYALGRVVGWPTRQAGILAGLAAGTAVVLLPAQQVRHDLKQYTADAAVALVILALVAWTERRWSRRRLGALVGLIAVGMLLSHTTAIVAVCAMTGLVVVPLVRRDWPRVIEAAVAGAAAALAVLAIYLGVARRGRTDGLDAYWDAYFPSVAGLPEAAATRLTELEPYLGLPAGVFLVLSALGVVTIGRLGRPALALATALVPVAFAAFALLRLYPLLDLRTSHVLLTIGAALGGIGLAGLVMAGARRWSTSGAAAPGRAWVATAAAAVVVVGALGGYAIANRQWLRLSASSTGVALPPMYLEDVRTQVEYVAAHRQPGDVVVVNEMGSYGFACYWAADAPTWVPSTNAIRWLPAYPDASNIVVTTARDPSALQAALHRARTLADARDSATIWLIRSHVLEPERLMWDAALADFDVRPLPTGIEPAAVITPRASGRDP